MSRPPLPPFTEETAAQKARMAEDAWNTRDPARVALAYGTDSRWRNRSEFINGRNEIIAFSLASGPRSGTTGLSRKCGRLAGTGSPYASLASGRTTLITGIAPTAMRTGNSMMMGLWRRDLHPSTTFPFWDQSANITGCSGVVPMTTQG